MTITWLEILDEHYLELRHEATRRGLPFDQFLKYMVSDVLGVYQGMTEEEIAQDFADQPPKPADYDPMADASAEEWATIEEYQHKVLGRRE